MITSKSNYFFSLLKRFQAQMWWVHILKTNIMAWNGAKFIFPSKLGFKQNSFYVCLSEECMHFLFARFTSFQGFGGEKGDTKGQFSIFLCKRYVCVFLDKVCRFKKFFKVSQHQYVFVCFGKKGKKEFHLLLFIKDINLWIVAYKELIKKKKKKKKTLTIFYGFT